MVTAPLKDRKELNFFLISQEHAPFQQSWEWGDFQEAAGNRIVRIGVFDDSGGLCAAATLVKKHLPANASYMYCPKGPVIASKTVDHKLQIIDALVNGIIDIARQEKAIFFRFEPPDPPEKYYKQAVRTIDVQPSRTSIIEINRDSTDIMKTMHPKTRYNIRLAEKKGLRVNEAGIEDFEGFWQLMMETRDRDGFRLHPKEYYRRMLGIGGAKPAAGKALSVALLTAEFEGRLIAGNIMAIFGDTATYVHGASSNAWRQVMAPYLLQWAGVRKAQELGCKFYDLYGIDERKWPGVTRFKLGFGGYEQAYPGTFDFPLAGWQYNIYRALRAARRLI